MQIIGLLSSILLGIMAGSQALAVAKPLVVRYPPAASGSDTRADYDRAVIDLMLEKSQEEFGPYLLQPAQPMTQSRALENLKNGTLVDVVATTSTSEREADFIPIKHCIHMGLMGIKILLIRSEDLVRFAKVKDLEDLKALVGGQGHDWPDVNILRSNGLNIMTGTNYDGLFKMLEKNRFDYFPRALPEIFDEQAAHAAQGLVVEPNLALAYPMPAYMFVNKANTALAKRLNRGFEIALKDGSFKKLFLSKHGENIRRAELKKRKVFILTNPLQTDPKLKVTLNFGE